MKADNRSRTYLFILFGVIMIALGISDSMRGVFFPIFQQQFHLSNSQLSLMVAVSYAGNLCFLFFGGRLLDSLERKTALIGLLCIWMAALAVFTVADHFELLLGAMFFAMGASTLLNTTINITSSLLFAASPGIVVNVLYFLQGLGTSLDQSIAGNVATSLRDFHLLSGALFIAGIAAVAALCLIRIPAASSSDHAAPAAGRVSQKKLLLKPVTIIFILLFACYFIAEHGLLNWLVSYCTVSLHIPMGRAANYLAVFFGSITAGRLLFSPLVDRLGIFKSIRLFGALAAVSYVGGMMAGPSWLWVLSASGIFFSIIYPTLVMAITRLYPRSAVNTVTGTIISIASLLEICFNLVFGKMIDRLGYRVSFLSMSVAILCFYGLFLVLYRMQRTAAVKADCQQTV